MIIQHFGGSKLAIQTSKNLIRGSALTLQPSNWTVGKLNLGRVLGWGGSVGFEMETRFLGVEPRRNIRREGIVLVLGAE